LYFLKRYGAEADIDASSKLKQEKFCYIEGHTVFIRLRWYCLTEKRWRDEFVPVFKSDNRMSLYRLRARSVFMRASHIKRLANQYRLVYGSNYLP
jgi:hypothetical protein